MNYIQVIIINFSIISILYMLMDKRDLEPCEYTKRGFYIFILTAFGIASSCFDRGTVTMMLRVVCILCMLVYWLKCPHIIKRMNILYMCISVICIIWVVVHSTIT